MSDCIFCKIVKGEIPSSKVFEDDKVLGFKDIYPQHPLHYLFIPKKHYTSLVDMPHEEADVMAHIFRAMKSVAEKEGFSEKGFRNVINTGTWGGQTVFHLHVHLMAGHEMSPKF